VTNEPWPLPPDWRWARFEDVANVASNLVDPMQHLDMPHVAPNHIESETGKLLPYATVATDGVTSPKHAFRSGQVLYSKIRPYLAKVVVAEFEGLCSADMYPIDTILEPRFLKWWMLTREFTRLAAGEQARTVLPKINVRGLKALPVPVAPVSEQRRIVEILEDHLSRLDAAGANVISALNRLRSWHESLLADGFSARSPSSSVSPHGVHMQLGNALDELLDHRGQTPGKLGGDFTDDGVRVISAIHIKGGRVDFEQRRRYVPPEMFIRWMPTRTRAGDVLLTSEAPLGSVAQVPDDEPLVLSQRLFCLRGKLGLLDNDYLYYFLQAPQARRQLTARSSGTTVTGIRQAELRQVDIDLPSLADQRAKVANLNLAEDAITSTTEALHRAQKRGVALRRDLLRAAFSGRLTRGGSP
jgi:type I restriction enzyme S subunit